MVTPESSARFRLPWYWLSLMLNSFSSALNLRFSGLFIPISLRSFSENLEISSIRLSLRVIIVTATSCPFGLSPGINPCFSKRFETIGFCRELFFSFIVLAYFSLMPLYFEFIPSNRAPLSRAFKSSSGDLMLSNWRTPPVIIDEFIKVSSFLISSRASWILPCVLSFPNASRISVL